MTMRVMARFKAQLKLRGWIYSNDTLGEYLQRGNRRISVMNTGPMFDCYVNDHVNGQWTRVAGQTGLISIEQVVAFVNKFLA